MNDSDALDISSNFTQDFDALSLHLLEAVFPPTVAIVAIGVFGFIFSVLIFAVITTTPNLRGNQMFVMLAHVAANDAALAVDNFIASGEKLHCHLVGTPCPGTIKSCLVKDLTRILFYTNSNGFLMLLAINRLIGVSSPAWYQKSTATKMFSALMGVMYLRSFGHCALIYVGANDNPVPICGYLPRSTWATLLLSFVALAWTSGIIVIYLAAVIITYLKLSNVKKTFGNLDRAREQLQVQVVFTLAYILLIHIVTTIVGNTLLSVVGGIRYGDIVAQNYIAVSCANCLISLSTPLYFPVLYKRCADFREACDFILIKLKVKKSSIAPTLSRVDQTSDQSNAKCAWR